MADNEFTLSDPVVADENETQEVNVNEKRNSSVGTGEGQVSAATSNVSALENASVDEKDAEWVRSGEKEAVYNPNTGLGVRVGGPYLDDIELREAEKRRAAIEHREPDYENMAGCAGVPLYTAGQMANAFGGGHPAVAQMIEDNKDNPKVGPNPVTEVDLVGYGEREVFETKKEEQKALRDVDNTKVTSYDNADTNYVP
jgi:hypothetical protein